MLAACICGVWALGSERRARDAKWPRVELEALYVARDSEALKEVKSALNAKVIKIGRGQSGEVGKIDIRNPFRVRVVEASARFPPSVVDVRVGNPEWWERMIPGLGSAALTFTRTEVDVKVLRPRMKDPEYSGERSYSGVLSVLPDEASKAMVDYLRRLCLRTFAAGGGRRAVRNIPSTRVGDMGLLFTHGSTAGALGGLLAQYEDAVSLPVDAEFDPEVCIRVLRQDDQGGEISFLVPWQSGGDVPLGAHGPISNPVI